MWGGKKARNFVPKQESSSSDFFDQAYEFEREVLSRCTCNVDVFWTGRDITATIHGRYNLPGTVENDKVIIKRLFNKHISNGRLFIQVD